MTEKVEVPKGAIALVNPIKSVEDVQEVVSFDDLDIALREQPSLYAYYATCTAKAQLQYNRAKQNVDFVEASVGNTLRKQLIASGEKVTDASLLRRIKTTQNYVNAIECENDAQYIYKLCLSLLDALEQRQQMIIQTCKRYELEMTISGAYRSKTGLSKDDIMNAISRK